MTCELQIGQYVSCLAHGAQKRLWPQGTRAATTSLSRHTKQEAEFRKWSLGDCFGDVTAVPSEELEPHDPVGLGGWGFRAAMASCTALKSNTRSEEVTGADMGIVDR